MKHTSPMLQHLFLLLTFAAIAVPAPAQLLRGYGIKAGLTASDVRSPDLDLGGEAPISFDSERRLGLAALAYVEWLNLPSFSIVTETGYIQRGYATEHEARDPQNNPAGRVRFDTRFDYWSFAAQAKMRLPNGVVAPYVLAGPRLDYFLGGDPEEEGTLASSYSSTAFGGTVGVGAEAPRLLPVAVFGEIRYSFDVTNSLPEVPRDAYNNAIDLLVGVRL